MKKEGRTLPVRREGEICYEIRLEQDFEKLAEGAAELGTEGRKICIVTDTHVGPLYLETVRERLSGVCSRVTVYTIEAGEDYKTLDTVRGLYEHLILEHFDRRDLLAALGGGVIGDLTGFAAATYLRGISFIQIPTTLLSQVDSSIGGKTGVDFDSYKNMVGAFHMPRLVYTNLSTLKTLDEAQFASGMGEVIKHGLIKNSSYYDWLAEHSDSIKQRDLDACEAMILESNRIKRDVVEQDPTEKGERALLNFGHTLGHAIEKLKDFSLLHGHCVALGCIAACAVSVRRGLLEKQDLDEVMQVMADFQLPVAVSGLNPEEVIEATKHDKKMSAGTIRFILLKKLGEGFIDAGVTEEEMKAGLEAIIR